MPAEPFAIDWAHFLEHDWQQRPRLFRGAVPAFVPPVDGDDLAGLAGEPAVESRIVERTPSAWELSEGPFNASAFRRHHPWTLLVQRVDQWVPEAGELLGCISPLPRWRIDDLMVSFASDGGSVGPHYDNYDVFLLQGQGRRRWEVGDYCERGCPLQPHDSLRLLASFETRKSYTLNCGDVLYLPPRIAHWGVAEGACTTFSLGLRAPRLGELVSRWTDRLLEQLDEERFYRDPHRTAARRPGELEAQDLQRAERQVRAALAAMTDADWLGELLTDRHDCEPADEASLQSAALALADAGAALRTAPGARLAWRADTRGLIVYANGTRLYCAGGQRAALEILCGGGVLRGEALAALRGNTDGARLINQCLSLGALCVDDA
jgi:50S ribosomal protein L16 3-hydroxylase